MSNMDLDNLRLSESIFWEPIRVLKDSAWAGHIPFAHWIVTVLRPNVFVELGIHSGVSYGAFCNAVKKNDYSTRCYAVDTWLGDSQAGLYSSKVFEDVNKFNKENFGSFSTLIQSTFDDAVANFKDGSVDLLHIDGFHSYDAVKHDFETWLPKMSDKGVVVLHDTNEIQEGFGVWKFWQELESKYTNHFHFLHCHGLGVVFVGSELPSVLQSFFNEKEDNILLIRNLFSAVGGKFERDIQLLIQQDHNDQQIASFESKLDSNIKRLQEEKLSLKNDLQNKSKEVNSLYANIWLFNNQVQSLEKDSLWRFLRKHPALKRFLTKYIGYVRASLKGRLKQERKRFRRAGRHVSIIENSPFFDAEWYKKKYFDIIYSGFSPA
ncbi:MAG: hypothetical protein DI598_10675, partial [Pseudopedobacter saltans]